MDVAVIRPLNILQAHEVAAITSTQIERRLMSIGVVVVLPAMDE
jgi:hypothetical protein